MRRLMLGFCLLCILSFCHPSDAALVIYNVSPSQTIGPGGSMTFGAIQAASPGSTVGTFILGSTTSPSFGVTFATSPAGVYTINNNNIEWCVGPALGGSYMSTGNIYQFSPGVLLDATGGGGVGSWISNSPGFIEVGVGGYWSGGGAGYAGLRINGGGGNYYYGWAHLNANLGALMFTIDQFVFENVANASITTGAGASAAVPEPNQIAASIVVIIMLAGGYFRSLGKLSRINAHSLHT